ncbi:MAG: DsbA family protein [Chloroflexi bacterium]|nr:DsbA family protein [Chloroflexota bacterium]
MRRAPDPTIEFNDYRRKRWEVIGSQPEAGEFRPYPPGKPFPQWSLPGLAVAKCVERQSKEIFERFDLLAFNALYRDGQNIADYDVLFGLAREAGADVEAIEAALANDTEAIQQSILEDWQEAVTKYSITGIPTVVVNDEMVIVGAVPTDNYRRAIRHYLEQPVG